MIGSLLGGGGAIASAHVAVQPVLTGQGMRTLERQMSTLGRSLTSAITGPIAAGFAAAGAGLAVGVKRLSSIEQSTHQIEQMGVATKDAEMVMGRLEKQLIGTTTTLDEGADALSRLIASGTDLDEVNDQLLRLQDAAAFGGAPLGELTDIFVKIQGEGKLTGETLNQLQHRIPGFTKAISEALGVTEGEFREMVSAGEVSWDDLMSIWDKAAGEGSVIWAGMAQSADKTLSGALNSARGFFSLFMAKIVESSGLWDGLKETMQGVLAVFKEDEFLENLESFGEALGEAFNLEELGGLRDWLPNALRDISKFLGDLEPEQIRTFAKNLVLAASAGPGLLLVSAAMRAIAATVALFSGPFGIIILAIAGLALVIKKAWDESETFRESVKGLWNVIQNELWPAIERLVVAIGDLFGFDWDNIGDAIADVIDIISDLTSWFADMVDKAAEGYQTLRVLMDEHGGFWEAMKVIILDVIEKIVEAILNWYDEALDKIPIIGGLIRTLPEDLQTTQGRMDASLSLMGSAWETFKNALGSVWDFIVRAFQIGSSIVSGALERIMAVLAVVWHFIRPTFIAIQTIVQFVVGKVIDAFENLGRFFQNIVIPIVRFVAERFRTFMGVIGAVVEFAWNNAIKPTFDAIVGGIKFVGGWIENLYSNYVQPVVETVLDKFDDLKTGTQDVFSSIKNIAQNIWRSIANTIRKPINFVIVTVYRNGIKALVEGVADKIGIKGLTLPTIDPIPEFHSGGAVPGSDELFAKLLGGEYVLSREAVQSLGGAESIESLIGMHKYRNTPGIGGLPFDFDDILRGFAAGAVDKALDLVRPLIDQIPNADSFPGNVAVSGMNKLLDGIVAWIKKDDEDNVPAFDGFAGAGVMDAGKMIGSFPLGWAAKMSWIRDKMNGQVSLNSGYRPGDPGYHGLGQAVDLGFPDRSEYTSGGLALKAFNLIKGAFFPAIRELIWDFAGSKAVWNGRNHFFSGPSAGPGSHADHIHWADQGGLLQPGLSVMGNNTGRPEPIFTASQWASIKTLAFSDRPQEYRFFLDGQEIDARVVKVVDEHDNELSRSLTAS